MTDETAEIWETRAGTFEVRASCPRHPWQPMRRCGEIARCSECGDALAMCESIRGWRHCAREKGHPGLHVSPGGTAWPPRPVAVQPEATPPVATEPTDPRLLKADASVAASSPEERQGAPDVERRRILHFLRTLPHNHHDDEDCRARCPARIGDEAALALCVAASSTSQARRERERAERAEAEARRIYLADGSYREATPEEVIAYRKAAAVKLASAEALAAALREVLRAAPDEGYANRSSYIEHGALCDSLFQRNGEQVGPCNCGHVEWTAACDSARATLAAHGGKGTRP